MMMIIIIIIIIINHCHKCLSNAVVGVPAEIWAATAPVLRGAEPTLTMSTVSQVNDRLDIVVLLLFILSVLSDSAIIFSHQ